MERGLPHIFDPKLAVFPGLVVIIPTCDDMPGKTLEIVGVVVVQGVLHSVLCPELLQREVEETVDMIEEPERYQGLHHIQIQLSEADVQIQQCLPEERGGGAIGAP